MHQEIFPQWLWDELSREGHIWVEGHPKADLSTTPASHRFFMLRALLVRYYCVPTFRVEDLAARIVNGESSGFVPPLIPYDMRPMLTIHLRKTDKVMQPLLPAGWCGCLRPLVGVWRCGASSYREWRTPTGLHIASIDPWRSGLKLSGV
eukprot:scaffold307_cov390-Prasinococcus_capsulatus_cf.AAC.30